MAKGIFKAWKRGDHFATQNHDKLAIWFYDEGVDYLESFLKKLPENWKMEAIAEMCRSLTNKNMNYDNIEIILRNAKCGITMADIQEQWAIQQRDVITQSLADVVKSDEIKKRKL